jgi:hypothetical protein
MPAVVIDFSIAATAVNADQPRIPVVILPIHYEPLLEPAAGRKATRS